MGAMVRYSPSTHSTTTRAQIRLSYHEILQASFRVSPPGLDITSASMTKPGRRSGIARPEPRAKTRAARRPPHHTKRTRYRHAARRQCRILGDFRVPHLISMPSPDELSRYNIAVDPAATTPSFSMEISVVKPITSMPAQVPPV